MAESIGFFDNVVSTDNAILGAGGLALLSVFGMVPRLGLGRALTLGLRSYSGFRRSFLLNNYPLSVRKSEIQLLNESMRNMKRGGCITVVGEKGCGKSCLIDTASNGHHGVVKISTSSGAHKSHIIDEALFEISGLEVNYLQLEYSAKRVIFFHNLIFKRSPIVVINVLELQAGDPYAQVTAAVSALVDDYGLRVIVDGLPSSIPPELLTTTPEKVMVVELMSREQLESIPEFASLIALLKAHKLDDPVWDVMGGSPVRYSKLGEIMTKFLSLPLSATAIASASDEVVDQVKDRLKLTLSDAFNKNILKSSVNTEKIIKTFREKKAMKMLKTELDAKDMSLDYPNKVFREMVSESGHRFVVPIDPAVSLIITESIVDCEGVLDLVDKLLQKTSNRDEPGRTKQLELRI